MLPFEFTVPGRPVSHQTTNRPKLEAWRELVRKEAAKHWGVRAALTQPLRIVVIYFHEGKRFRMDNDNLVKPIQDALNGLVYVNDTQILDTVVRRTNIDGSFRIRYESMTVLEAFSRGEAFVHVRVAEATGHEILPK